MTSAVVLLAAPAGFAVGALLGLTWFDLLRRRALLARRLLAGASACAAVLAPAAPTGSAIWDGTLRAALAGCFVILAGRSRLVWCVPGALLAAVGTVGSQSASAAALALVGFSVAFVSISRRMPLAGAVMGAVLVQVALRMQWPAQTGATAALAVLVLTPMAVSGYRRSPRRERRVMKRIGLALAAVAGIGSGVAAGGGLLVRARLEEGVLALNVGVAAVRGGDHTGTTAALSSAAQSFGTAQDILEAPWLLPARIVPVVSQNLRALIQVARTGQDLALTGAETVAASDLQALKVVDGRLDLEPVRNLVRPLVRAVQGLGEASGDLAAVARTPWLIGPLGERLHRETADLEQSRAEADVALDVVQQLPGLLGGTGHRRYFLAIQTPSELRGSGGIVGSFGEVTAEDGKMAVGRFGRDGDLNTQGTPPDQRSLLGPPDYVGRYARFQPQKIWQNVSISPHFPSVGEVIAGLYPQSGGSEVDGVVSVDPVGLSALLEVVGPVAVPPWPEPITAENAERVLLFDQYVRLEGAARVDFLGDVAEAVARQLTTGPLPSPAVIVAALSASVRGHHLMFHSRSGSEQALFRRIGADGGLPPVRADSLAVVNVNAGGNKLDWFLRRTTDYRARRDPETGRMRATLTVTLRNEAPAAGLPSYIIGSSLASPDPLGTNRTYLSVFTPLALTRARLDGQDVPVETAREVGRNVFSQYLVLPPGTSRTFVLDLAGELADGRTYSLDLRSQPMVVPEVVSVEVTLGDRTLVRRPASALPEDEVLPEPHRAQRPKS